MAFMPTEAMPKRRFAVHLPADYLLVLFLSLCSLFMDSVIDNNNLLNIDCVMKKMTRSQFQSQLGEGDYEAKFNFQTAKSFKLVGTIKEMK